MPWFLAAAFLLAYEAYALLTHRPTLSRMMWNGAKHWPPLGWFIGLVVGFLSAHFFWPLCP